MIVTEFLARLGVQLDPKSMKKGDKEITNWATKAAATAGAALGGFFAVDGVKNFIHDLTAQGSALKDMSERVGIGTRSLQELGLAAKLAGSSQEGLETGLKFLGRNAQTAADGSKELKKAFKGAGIELKTSGGQMKTSEQLLADVADALQKTEDPGKRTAIAMKLLGRSGAELIPLLKDGAAGLEAVRQEARDLGGGLSEDLIKNADELDDNLARLNFSFLSIKSTIGNVVLPVIDRCVRVFISLSKVIQENLRQNKFLQIAFGILTALVVGFGIKSIWAARETIIAWTKAAAPFLVLAAAILVLAAIFDELHAMLTGGRSLLGKFLDKYGNGVGTADAVTRSWADGLRILNEQLDNLANGKWWKIWDQLKETIGGAGAALENSQNKAAMRGKMEAATEASKSSDPVLAQIGKERLAELQAQDFGLGSGFLKRSTGQGMGAGVERNFKGQASGSAVGKNIFQDTLKAGAKGAAAAHAPAPAAVAPAAAAGGTTTIAPSTSVTVQATTGASPKEIAREAEKAARRVNAQQARDLVAAHANRTATLREGVVTTPVGALELDLE